MMLQVKNQVQKNNINILYIESLIRWIQDTKGSLLGGFFDMYR